MSLIKTAAEIWRKYTIDAVPASGPNQPDKTDIIVWGTYLESLLGVGVAGLMFPTLAALNADLGHAAQSSAIVYNDSTAANNGIYVKSGASGTGSWSRVGDLPNAIVRLTVTGGTANAIVATAPETPTVPGSKLYLMTPTGNNTGATTVAVNGGAAVAIKTALGSDLVTGSLIAGSQVLMAWAIDHYQLLISVPVDASGVLNDVLAARDDAEDAATAAASSAAALGNQVHQYDTRAMAISATIPAGVNFLRTLAYDSSFQPSSGALFKRVAAGTAFIDTWPLTGTIAGGSGYVNGTYYGVQLSGGNGIGISATVTVSGGAVTAVSHATCPGNAYKVGDVLTGSNVLLGGSGSGFTYTIATISSPLASFVNTVDSSRWQYLVDQGGCPHVNQFGAKPDWAGLGTDGSSTNNFPIIQAALFFGARTASPVEGYSSPGDVVKCAAGSYMIMSGTPAASLIVPYGVYLEGVGGTTLRVADAFSTSIHCITLGDPNSHRACFRAGLRRLTLSFARGLPVNVNVFMVYSNNTQDGGGLSEVYMYTGQRGGFFYEISYGGGSVVMVHDISLNCEGVNPGMKFDIGSTVVSARNVVYGAPSSGTNNTENAIVLVGSGGGMYNFDGGHAEWCKTGLSVNLTGGVGYVSIKNWTGGAGLDQLVALASTNVPGNCALQQCAKNGATVLVTNGQPSGSPRAGDVQPKDGIVFFNP